MPLILALHATNFSATNMWASLAKDQPMADRYVIVAPQERQDLTPSNFESRPSTDFSVLLANLLAELCIDQSRIFGVGNGSGGRAIFRWVNYLAKAATPPTRLQAAAMVGTFITSGAGSLAVATIFIHPLNSPNSAGAAGDADGAKALQHFRWRNGCAESSAPVTAAGCVAGGMAVNPGCVDFDGCAQPLRFCHHDDLTNWTAGDPWPCMASSAIFQFFEPYL
jgi:hypothetical protein